MKLVCSTKGLKFKLEQLNLLLSQADMNVRMKNDGKIYTPSSFLILLSVSCFTRPQKRLLVNLHNWISLLLMNMLHSRTYAILFMRKHNFLY